MNIDIKKNGKVRLKDTPYFVPISDTNIRFSNMDVGTALITFQIMKGSLPLQVSKKNVYVYAYLESRNGTRSEVIDLQDVDPLNGKVALQLDKDFLVGATNSIVDGQLYVTLHKWNDVNDDFSDTVALQKFSFSVEDALVNQISGVTKTEYIRTFDQLKSNVKERITELEEDVGNIETLVDRVKQSSDDAIKNINDTRKKIIDEVTQLSNDTENNITNLQDETIKRLNNSADNYINDIKNYKDELINLINEKYIVSSSDLDERIASLNWQKHKLTSDSGDLESYSLVDFNNPEGILGNKTAIGYAGTSNNQPKGTSGTGYFKYFVRTANYKKLEYRPYNSNAVYEKTKINGTWSEWSEVYTSNSSLPVQQYKLTKDDGTVFTLTKFDFNNIDTLETGNYFLNVSYNSPFKTTSYGYLRIEKASNNSKKAIATPGNSNNYYVNYKWNGTWSDWEEINPKASDTGWLPINTINDVKNNSPFNNEGDNGFQSAYRIIEENGVTRKMVRINVSNVTNQTVIANLPKDFAKNVQFHYVRVPINMGYGLVGIFPSGSMHVYIESSMRESWVKGDSHYFYGQFEWTE